MTVADRIIENLTIFGPGTVYQIASTLQKPATSIRRELNRLTAKNRVESVGTNFTTGEKIWSLSTIQAITAPIVDIAPPTPPADTEESYALDTNTNPVNV